MLTQNVTSSVASAVLSKAFASGERPGVGVHPVDLTVNITDNLTQDTTTHRLMGSVTVGKDQMIAATATIPWIKVIGRMALSLGATQANVVQLLRDTILSAASEGSDIGTALQAMDIRVAGTIDMVKKELAESLPKIPRAGAVSVKVTEAVDDSDIIVVANA